LADEVRCPSCRAAAARTMHRLEVRGGAVGQHAGQFLAVEGLDDIEEADGLAGLVGLQGADQAQLKAGTVRCPALHRLLHARARGRLSRDSVATLSRLCITYKARHCLVIQIECSVRPFQGFLRSLIRMVRPVMDIETFTNFVNPVFLDQSIQQFLRTFSRAYAVPYVARLHTCDISRRAVSACPMPERFE
jgi:hypothetical protein